MVHRRALAISDSNRLEADGRCGWGLGDYQRAHAMAAQIKAIGTQARSSRSRALRARRLTESNSRRLDILGLSRGSVEDVIS
jgi:hypothetical protein